MGLASADDVPPTAEEAGAAPKLEEVLDDLAMRFVVTCPAEEQESFERLLFQVEAAFWFYEDQYREIWPHAFPTFNLLTFSQQMFKCCPLLAPFQKRTKEIYDAFTSYKAQIPTCGGMLLTPDNKKILLVKSWKGNAWGFPKGKIDKDESKESCAAREVLEEIGYDITSQLEPEVYIESQWKDQTMRLYVVHGVPEDFEFATRTKKEIGEIAWHKVKDLPATREEQQKAKVEKSKYWMVAPFIVRLRKHLAEIDKKQKKGSKGGSQQQQQQQQPSSSQLLLQEQQKQQQAQNAQQQQPQQAQQQQAPQQQQAEIEPRRACFPTGKVGDSIS